MANNCISEKLDSFLGGKGAVVFITSLSGAAQGCNNIVRWIRLSGSLAESHSTGFYAKERPNTYDLPVPSLNMATTSNSLHS